MHLENVPIWSAKDINVLGPILSVWFPVSQMFGWSADFYVASTSGPISGTVTVNTSNSPASINPSDSHNVIDSNPTQLQNSSLNYSGGGSFGYQVSDANYNWIQFVLTITTQSGGNITGRLNAKGF